MNKVLIILVAILIVAVGFLTWSHFDLQQQIDANQTQVEDAFREATARANGYESADLGDVIFVIFDKIDQLSQRLDEEMDRISDDFLQEDDYYPDIEAIWDYLLYGIYQ